MGGGKILWLSSPCCVLGRLVALLLARGPPPTRASCPCPAPSGCLVPGPPAKGVTARSGSPTHSAAGASHACLWPRRPAPPTAASACLVA